MGPCQALETSPQSSLRDTSNTHNHGPSTIPLPKSPPKDHPRQLHHAHKERAMPHEGLCNPLHPRHTRPIFHVCVILSRQHTTRQAAAAAATTPTDAFHPTRHILESNFPPQCIICALTVRARLCIARAASTHMGRLLRSTPHAQENWTGLLGHRCGGCDVLWSDDHDQQWLRRDAVCATGRI